MSSLHFLHMEGQSLQDQWVVVVVELRGVVAVEVEGVGMADSLVDDKQLFWSLTWRLLKLWWASVVFYCDRVPESSATHPRRNNMSFKLIILFTLLFHSIFTFRELNELVHHFKWDSGTNCSFILCPIFLPTVNCLAVNLTRQWWLSTVLMIG